MLVIHMVYQRVANAADAPFSDAPQGGGVNSGNTPQNLMYHHQQPVTRGYSTKPSRIQEGERNDGKAETGDLLGGGLRRL